MYEFVKAVRACLGKPNALAEMKHATAMARRFAALRLADERQTVEDMRTDRSVLVPKGKQCRLNFE
jgi:hypothetical protein